MERFRLPAAERADQDQGHGIADVDMPSEQVLDQARRHTRCRPKVGRDSTSRRPVSCLRERRDWLPPRR